MCRMGRHRRIGMSVAATLMLASGQLFAQEARAAVVKFNIEPQPLAQALNTWADQAGLQIIWPVGDPVAYESSPALRGTLEPMEALRVLLGDTGLTYSLIGGGRTVAIHGRDQSGPLRTADSGAVTPPPLASAAATYAAASPPAAASVPPASTPGQRDTDTPNGEISSETIDEVLVTGTHISGTSELATPVIVFSRKDIEDSGYSTVEGLFESLPQNLDAMSEDGIRARGSSDLASSNVQRAVTVDLRGLGPQSTLVLVNGQRRAGSSFGRVTDISTIPLSALERVEVATGGTSAVYGGDAVAGTVNLVTRREFDGAESQIYYGGARAGGERLQLSQMFGRTLTRGGFVLAYDYARDWALDLVDTGVVRAPSIIGLSPLRFDIVPDATRHSALLSGRFGLNDAVEFYTDGLYSSKDAVGVTRDSRPNRTRTASTDSSTDQYSATLGSIISLRKGWKMDVAGSLASTNSVVDGRTAGLLAGNPFQTQLTTRDHSKDSSLSVVLDGPLFSLGERAVTAAVGAEWREQRLSSPGSLDDSRTVKAGFAEARVPLLGDVNGGPARLEASLAARYDKYSDVGDTTNPQFGLIWRPLSALTARAAYSTAFRAPDLFDQAFPYDAFIVPLEDPQSSNGTAPVLVVSGIKPDLKPEEAETWSVGIDFTPEIAGRLKVSLSYFNIEYKDRLDVPASGTEDQVLIEEANYGGLVNRAPGANDTQQLITGANMFDDFTEVGFDPNTQNVLDVFPDLVVFDNRLNNISVENVHGVDLSVSSRFDTAAGVWSFGLNGTYTQTHERSITEHSPLFSILNEPGLPVDMRLRASAGWLRGPFGANLFVNYVDSYKDTYSDTPSTIDSWITVDMTLRLVLPRTGFSATLAVNNLLDEAPPEFLEDLSGMGYDSVNSNAMGRYISMSLAKRW